jgi:hypothetical protein
MYTVSDIIFLVMPCRFLLHLYARQDVQYKMINGNEGGRALAFTPIIIRTK